MTTTKDLTLVSQTPLPSVALSAVRAIILHTAAEHELDVSENTETRLSIDAHYGRYSFFETDGTAQVSIASSRSDWLYALKESLAESIAAFAPETAEGLQWSDADPAGGLPPNFQFITVQSVKPAGPAFLRVTALAEDLSEFKDESIHFRLILPPAGLANPEWPRLSNAGATVWPKGDKALHRPVYTVRRCDPETGLLEFDIFVHEGGRATTWAQTVQPGTKVGLTGPGGGGVPETRAITLYADETGFPAVAHILDSLPADAVGHAVLAAKGGEGCGYPMPQHPGIALRWISPDNGASLADTAIRERADFGGHYLWFAGEKSETQALRSFCKEQGIDTKAHYVAAYWSCS